PAQACKRAPTWPSCQSLFLVGPCSRTSRFPSAPQVQMAHYPQPDDSWFTDQSTHPGFNWYSGCTQFSEWDDVWYLLANPALVQVKDWPYRFHADQPCLFMVSRMRTTDDARVSRIEFLQFNCDCVLRSCYIRDSGDANLRGFRRCDPLL